MLRWDMVQRGDECLQNHSEVTWRYISFPESPSLVLVVGIDRLV
jgi:hypothetical protein